jgi:hypothetical protein
MTKEEILREETRSLRDLNFRMVQWGVSVLVALQTGLFFVRKEIISNLIDREVTPGEAKRVAVESLVHSGKLAKGGVLSLKTYLVGTTFLLAVACIFIALTLYVSTRHRFYRDELKGCKEALVGSPEPYTPIRWILMGMFFFFPLFDLVARCFLRHF